MWLACPCGAGTPSGRTGGAWRRGPGRRWERRGPARAARGGVAQLGRAEAWFARHGGKTILLGRFVGFLRALAPFVAGASVMPYRRFLPYNAAGAVLWATGFVLLGYGLDVGWRRVEHWTNTVSVLLGAGGALLLRPGWLRRGGARQAAHDPRPGGGPPVPCAGGPSTTPP